MAALTTTLSDILKNLYEGTAENQLNEERTLAGLLPRKDGYEGNQVELALRTGRTQSIGFQAETDVLPIGDQQRYDRATIDLKEYYGTIKISQRLLQKARSNRGAFVREFNGEMEGLVTDMLDYLNLVLCNDGSGALCEFDAADVSLLNNTITCNTTEDARKFGIGMICNGWDQRATAATILNYDGTNADIVVSAVALDTGIITFSTDLATAGTFEDAGLLKILARKGARAASTRYECMGIEGIVDAGDPPLEASGLQGIAATNAYWQALELSDANSVNRPLTDRLLQQGIDGIRIRSGMKPTHILTTYGVRMEYANQQLNVRRRVNTTALSGQTAGGFRENEAARDYIEYNDIPLIPEKYCKQNTAYLLCMPRLWLARWMPFRWLQEDGKILKWSPTRAAAWEAIYGCMLELVTNQRNAHCKINHLDGDDAA